jgi:MICOS complex subunit MIC12
VSSLELLRYQLGHPNPFGHIGSFPKFCSVRCASPATQDGLHNRFRECWAEDRKCSVITNVGVQTGGVTLTLGIAYLTVLAHERNRRAQAEALRSQSRVLTSLLEPSPIPPPQSRAELAREERSSLTETLKDRWNDEVEHAVRRVQRADWNEVREGMEGAVARLLGSGLQRSREGIEVAEKQAAPKVQEAVDRGRAAAKKGADQAAAGINSAAAATITEANLVSAQAKDGASKIASEAKKKADQAGVKAGELGSSTKTKADRLAADAKAGAQDAAEVVRHPGGTIDAARGALRDTFNKGIEKGKEAIGKAQAAVGLAAEKMESKAQAATLSHSSAVEKALHERYEKPSPLDKTVEETLAERYKPIEERDNTVLRGV